MIVGFVLIGAWLVGTLFDKANLPKISGYLSFGLLAGPSMWAVAIEGWLPDAVDALVQPIMPLLQEWQVEEMHFVKDLAISLIAITAGGEIHLKWLAGQFMRVLALTVATVILVGMLIGLAIVGIESMFPIFGADASTLQVGVAIMLLALIASGNSPSVAIAVISELHADGPLSRTTLAVTVCKDLLIIVMFAAFLAIAKGLLDENTSISAHFLLAVSAELGGST